LPNGFFARSPCDGLDRRMTSGRHDDDERIRVPGPIFTTGLSRLEALIDPPAKAGGSMEHRLTAQPVFVLVEMFRHDLAVVHANEQVANRELGAGIVNRAPGLRSSANAEASPVRSEPTGNGSEVDIPRYREFARAL